MCTNQGTPREGPGEGRFTGSRTGHTARQGGKPPTPSRSSPVGSGRNGSLEERSDGAERVGPSGSAATELSEPHPRAHRKAPDAWKWRGGLSLRLASCAPARQINY
jgi:hypothetical protein